MGYAPTIWPGTSAGHLDGVNNPAKLDYFPRYNGTFYEKTAKAAIQLKPFFVYNAMFDEINEGLCFSRCLHDLKLTTRKRYRHVRDAKRKPAAHKLSICRN